MDHRTRDQHLFDKGPKRILALDGGGLRGVMTLQMLKKIEDMLRERHGGGDDFRLCDYFDLIGGTSTGSVIAASLATGDTVDEIDAMYRRLGGKVFNKDIFRFGFLRPKFSEKPFKKELKDRFGDMRLGSDEIRTGLAIMAKRMDTGSPWIVHNNSRGKYFEAPEGSDAEPNKNFLLRTVVRASTAAPKYFAPERIKVSQREDGAFVDGAVSPHNNPALQLLMLATLAEHKLAWPWGEHKLFVVSVGTGFHELKLDPDEFQTDLEVERAIASLVSIMDDASALNELILQWLSNSPTARKIDSEVGDLSGDLLGAGGKASISYVRYNAQLDDQWLKAHGFHFSGSEIEKLRNLDRPENMPTLAEIGMAAARSIEDAHFPKAFNLQ